MNVTFEDVVNGIRDFQFDREFDMVVGIANGGVFATVLLAERLGIEWEVLKINYRDPENKPRYQSPKLLEKIGFDCRGKRILLVDDRIKTGTTIAFAKELLAEATSIHTFAVNGNGDYYLYNTDCFRMPWRSAPKQ